MFFITLIPVFLGSQCPSHLLLFCIRKNTNNLWAACPLRLLAFPSTSCSRLFILTALIIFPQKKFQQALICRSLRRVQGNSIFIILDTAPWICRGQIICFFYISTICSCHYGIFCYSKACSCHSEQDSQNNRTQKCSPFQRLLSSIGSTQFMIMFQRMHKFTTILIAVMRIFLGAFQNDFFQT